MNPSPSLTARLGLAGLTGALFFLIYGAVNAYTATLAQVPSLYAPWERQIPFVDWMIVPYMSLDLLFVGAFLLCGKRQELGLLAQRISLAILLSASGFLLMPLRFGFSRPETDGLSGMLFDLLALDLPFNQCPSLHISLGLLIGAVYWRHTRGIWRVLTALWFGLILLSPLLVYQHHTVDIIGGGLAWLLVMLLIPGDLAIHQRVALRYLGLAVILGTLAASLDGPGWLLALPLPGVLLTSLAYHRQRPHWIAHGAHPLKVVVLAPLWLALWINWWLWSRREPNTMVEVSPGLWLGRRLNAQEAATLPARGIHTVLDLACELPATPLPSGLQRHRLALLDLVPPSTTALTSTADYIASQRQQGGVYVHCALGYGRAALAVAHYLAGGGPLTAQLQRLSLQRRVVIADDPAHPMGST